MTDHMYTSRRSFKLTNEQYFTEWSKKYKFQETVSIEIGSHPSIDPTKLQTDRAFKNGFARLPLDDKIVYFFNSVRDVEMFKTFVEIIRASNV